MSDLIELKKITRTPNGMYHWRSDIGLDYFRGQLWTGAKVCIIIGVLLMAVGAVLYFVEESLALLIIFLACGVGFLLLTGLIFGLTFLINRHPGESYSMCETYVMTGGGRSASFFDFDKTKALTIRRDYLELRGRLGKMRVYAPAEDFPFVREFIKNRMPGEAEILYE